VTRNRAETQQIGLALVLAVVGVFRLYLHET
jgi:hypothetical protein